MRTFVALNLPAEQRRQLAAAFAPLRVSELPVRWTREESLHLTLKFLGDIEGGEVPRLKETLSAVGEGHAPVTLKLSGVGAFPSLRRASIIWAGVAPEPELMTLQRDVEVALSRLGYAREQKPFRPHVTIGRARSGARAPDIERLAGSCAYEGSTDVVTMDLMRSHPEGGGARYEPLLRLPLGRRAAT